jgi:hypothetical protein
MGTAASTGNAADAEKARDREMNVKPDSISNWTANRVGVWLMNTCELGAYAEMFYTARINGAVLRDLTDEELEELGIHNRMHRKRIFTEICKQNDFELDELERHAGTPSPRQYWSNVGGVRRKSKNGEGTVRKDLDAVRGEGGGGAAYSSPKFTLGPHGTPRAWSGEDTGGKKGSGGSGGASANSAPSTPNPAAGNARPGDVQASTPKGGRRTVAEVNLFEALDSVEAQEKRKHAKWYANKVVEKSLIAMRAALKTARGMAVLQAEARYHGSLEAARETLMHNTRLQARQKAIEDFYSGNWRHKGVSPMAKCVRACMREEEEGG